MSFLQYYFNLSFIVELSISDLYYDLFLFVNFIIFFNMQSIRYYYFNIFKSVKNNDWNFHLLFQKVFLAKQHSKKLNYHNIFITTISTNARNIINKFSLTELNKIIIFHWNFERNHFQKFHYDARWNKNIIHLKKLNIKNK